MCSGSGLIYIHTCHANFLLSQAIIALFANQSGTSRYSVMGIVGYRYLLFTKLPSMTQACHIGHQLRRKVAINCSYDERDSLSGHLAPSPSSSPLSWLICILWKEGDLRDYFSAKVLLVKQDRVVRKRKNCSISHILILISSVLLKLSRREQMIYN